MNTNNNQAQSQPEDGKNDRINGKKTIYSIEKSDNPAYAAGMYLNDLLSTNINKPILLMLAGGSARAILPYINPEYLTPKLTVSVTDERFTDDMGENNFDVLQTTEFYQDLMSVDAYCINTSVVGGVIAYEGSDGSDSATLEKGAEMHANIFEKAIRDWKSEFSDGVVIGLFGMGKDGHTAGIMPGIYDDGEFTQRFLGESDIAIVHNPSADADFPLRVSCTLSFMKRIDFPLFYITGDSKKPALQKALNPDTKYSDIPARIVLEMKNPVIFTDISV